MASSAWLLLGAGIFLGALYFHRKYYLLQYLFFLRYPLLLALVLLLLPLTAAEVTGAAFRNLFVHERPSALAMVTMLALLVAWETMFVFGFLFEHTPQRVKLRFHRGGRPEDPWTNEIPGWLKLKRVRFPVFALLAIPIIATSSWYSFAGRVTTSDGESMSAAGIALALAIGAGLAAFFVAVLTYTGKKRLLPALPELLVRFTAFVDRILFGSTTIDTDPRIRQERHHTFRIEVVFYFAAITFLVYLGFAFLPPEPGDDLVRFDLPAMIYVLLLAMLLGWIFPWLSFLLDRHRMVPELAIAILVFVFYNVFGTDHYFHVQSQHAHTGEVCPAEEPGGEGISPADQARARQAWVGLDSTPPVIVASSGGGITAAYWVTVVLDEIERGLRIPAAPEAGFSDTVTMVSGTSGGSVGLLYYTDAFSEKAAAPRRFTDEELAWMREAAGSSSLNAVGWGLVYRDFWRLVFPPIVDRRADRASAMEARWTQGLLANRRRWQDDRSSDPVHDPTFREWGRGVSEGWRPATAFNAVLAETGELFQIADVDLPPLRNLTNARPTERQYSELFPGTEISAVTAARLSATFPWVTPAARPDLPDECDDLYHSVDGGYYDNFGVISALAYRKALGASADPILIEIRASDSRHRAPPDSDGGLGIAALGPIQALLAVRSTSQLGRNETLVEATFPPSRRIVFELRRKSPLSWHLAPRERADIEAEWAEPHNQHAFEALCEQLEADCQ